MGNLTHYIAAKIRILNNGRRTPPRILDERLCLLFSLTVLCSFDFRSNRYTVLAPTKVTCCVSSALSGVDIQPLLPIQSDFVRGRLIVVPLALNIDKAKRANYHQLGLRVVH